MRWRVTYDLTTSTWHALGRSTTVRAASRAHAVASVERGIYARKDAILAERHDDPGTGFAVIITAVEPLDTAGRA